MTKNMRRLVGLLLVFLCIFSLSCGLNTGEAKNASAKVEMPWQKVNGIVGSSLNTASVRIKLSNVSPIDGQISKTIPLEPSVKGVSATLSKSGNDFLVAFTGTPEEALKDYIKITIPKEFLQNRISPITVDANNLKWNIVSKDEPYVYQTTASDINLTNFIEGEGARNNMPTITARTLVLKAQNAAFKALEDTDVSSWFEPSIKGVSYVVTDNQEGRNQITISISGAPLENSTASAVKVTIPRGTLMNVDGSDYTYPLEAAVRISNNVTLSYAARVADSVTVSGFTSNTDDNKIEKEIQILLNGIQFFRTDNGNSTTVAVANQSVASWFAPQVPGLSYTAKYTVEKGQNSMVVLISGTPKNAIDEEFTIRIPASYVSSNDALNVDTKGSKYRIRKNSNAYVDVNVYDLATYGDVNLSMKSPNRSATKKANGDELTFVGTSDDLLLHSENATVTLPGGLSRRGYTLAGFNKKELGKPVSTDVLNLDYSVANANEVKIDDNGDITIYLKDADKGETVNLYAIWEIDLDAWHLKKNDDGTYNTTLDISLNESGENAYLPAVFDVDKAYPDDAEKQALYIDYPYYRESVVLSKGLKFPGNPTSNYVDAADVEFTYDFVIGEQVITGYMLDELRSWNDTLEESERYSLPLEAAALPSGAATDDSNAVGYGALYYDSRYVLKSDKSDPITYVTVSQGMVIANALTAYYNEKKGLSAGDEGYLDPAYVVTDTDAPIKKISEADVLYSATTTAGAKMAKDGAKGFRLPTSAEWGLAARIVPQSTYPTELTGAHTSGAAGDAVRNYLYPQLTRSNMWSGADIIASSTDARNPLADTWVWYRYNSYGTYGNGDYTYGSHGFLKNDTSEYGRTEGWSVLDKKPNNIGVYGMSGNVWEWCDTVYNGTTISYRRLRGGSFASNASNTRVGYLDGDSASIRYGHCGLRLVRLP